ncbi:TPA: phage tail tape measure protein [Escherichia coli]|uniref:phage tail tape measure protein n=1 Tax=Escherichia coli TaxID=562 RepID=UPI00077530BD|nr:phage tail tape measure protein [Escherichia coli]KXP50142.1 tail length tape measure protein [Escherichia coli]HAM3893570.1 phage tail tape measure protein [Escherichia coli]HCG2925174.1 phage tail tape measure protein [Escherichia coli]HCG2934122.1 phage tail tape measure protein [Escherichia coli]HCG3098818.1 phage tail tape measure protein [Escherichia coli]
MAGKSLGTLTIDLIAKVGGFVGGLSQAERASQKWRKQVQDDAKAVATAFTGFATAASAAAVGVGVAGFNLLKTTSKQITETDRWAKSLNMSTQSLLAWQYAAEKAGVSGDQMADIFKDIGDKIGDAVLNKSGEAVDALNALGLSAKKLAGESPDKQLLAISDALGKINTNAEKTTILESLGNDLSKLLPLLDQGGEKLRQYMDAAKKFGVAPNDADIEKLVKVNSLFEDMETQVNGVKIEIATGLANVDLSGLQKSITDMGNVFKDPAVIQGITDLVGGVVDLATWLVKVGAEAGKLIDLYKGGQSVGANASLDEIERRIKNLQADLDDKGFLADVNRIGMDTAGKRAELEQLQRRASLIKSLNNLPLTPATVSGKGVTKTNFNLGAGESNGKTSPDAGAKKLESAFKATELAYQKQIALIDTTGKKVTEVTELQRLQFDIADGKLTGLNETQKTRLTQLATEVDRLNDIKKLNQENLKLAEFIINLQTSNRNDKASLDIDIAGRWLGDEERERMRERLRIEADFLSQQADLQKQYQSGDITKSLYDRETEALNDSLAERLRIQEEYYQQVDQLRNDGTAGFVSGLATQIEASMDLYSNMQEVGAQAFSSLTDMIVEWAETGKMNVKDFASTFIQSMGAALLQYAAAQVAMAALQAFTAMIGVPYVGPALAGPAATAAAASAGVLMLGVSTALKGQAHDGIDSVPETGTWLLQKGERVTTAKTSAKLDATLDRVGRQSTGGQAPNINIPLEIHGDPDQRTLMLIEGAVMRGAKLGYQMTTNDLASGAGKASKALKGGWTVGRKQG